MYYGVLNGGGIEGGVCGYKNMYVLGYGFMIVVLSFFLFQVGVFCGVCFELRCRQVSVGGRNWCWSYVKSIVVICINFCFFGFIGGWCNQRVYFDLFMFVFLFFVRKEGGVVLVYYRR